jgi:hypothetical protein
MKDLSMSKIAFARGTETLIVCRFSITIPRSCSTKKTRLSRCIDDALGHWLLVSNQGDVIYFGFFHDEKGSLGCAMQGDQAVNGTETQVLRTICARCSLDREERTVLSESVPGFNDMALTL